MPFLKNWNKVSNAKRLENLSKRQGLRHAIFNTVGDKYIGEWQNDLKTGKGVMLTRLNDLYEGDFLEGFRHGFGVLAYRNEDNIFILEYRGHWKRGRMCGFGMRRYRDGSVYVGNWRNGKRHGYGLMWFTNGQFYAGDWAKDQREGLGMLVMPRSWSRYEGSWKGDCKHGKGRYIHLDTGQVQNGVWRSDICSTCTFIDIKYRQTAPFVTPFPITKIELLHWEDLCEIYEQAALFERERSCLDVIVDTSSNKTAD